MNSQITGVGGQPIITPKSGVKPAVAKSEATPATTPVADTFKETRSNQPAADGSESRVGEVKSAPTEASPDKVVESDAKAKAPTEQPAPKTLTMLNDMGEGPQETPGFTLAELAKSATQSLAKGVEKLVLGDQLAPFKAELDTINGHEAEAKKLKTPEQFQAKTQDFKDRLKAGETLEQMRSEVYAVAREAARQATEMRAYDCQVIGALAMDDGHIAEMKTGEGKTLTAVLPLYLNALAGKGAHLVTVNETLAKRDAEWMGPIFKKLGMTVGCVTEDQDADTKREGYNCDVTYVSDRALGFDYLRDRGALDTADRVQRGHFFALIDEVDEVLIDEARTPMIMSGPAGPASPDYKVFNEIIKDLVPGDDFKINEKKKTTWLTDGGLIYVENELMLGETRSAYAQAEPGSTEAQEAEKTFNQLLLRRDAIRKENAAQKIFDDLDYDKPNPVALGLGMTGKYNEQAWTVAEAELQAATEAREKLSEGLDILDLYAEENVHRVHYMDACLKANTLYVLGDDYSLEGSEVKIIDESKGRVSNGKRYSQGLHQALEAKEGLKIRPETRTISQITMPELVKLYERKSGMTGTGKSSEAEFMKFYGLDVLEIPTNKPVIRTDHPDMVFATKEAKFAKIVAEATTAANNGRPVLVGAADVNACNRLVQLVKESGFPADRLQVLNAELVKSGEVYRDPDAGRSGAITLATGQRAEGLEHDKINYKKLAQDAAKAAAEGQAVVLDAYSNEDVTEILKWVSSMSPAVLTTNPKADFQGVQIRNLGPDSPILEREIPQGFTSINSQDYAVEKPLEYEITADNMDKMIAKGIEAFRNGEPVILRMDSSQHLSEVAGGLLDRGLGLAAIPMVCDGKEKENTTIDIAGRSEILTISTNMVGRGANVKADKVAGRIMAKQAYSQAAKGEAVTVSFEDEDDAKRMSLVLSNYLPVQIGDSEATAQPGQVLLKVGEDLPKVEGDNQLHDSDFKTHGLLVIGSERNASQRVDNQFVGRSGRQGNEGDSIFITSLQDDNPRVHGGEKMEPLLGLFGDKSEGISSDFINGIMRNAQSKVENIHFEQRDNANKYDEVNVAQRDAFYGLREEVLTEQIDPVDFVADYGTQGLVELLKENLPDKKTYSPEDVTKAIGKLTFSPPLPVDFKTQEPVPAQVVFENILPQVHAILSRPELVPPGADYSLQAVAQQVIDRFPNKGVLSPEEVRQVVGSMDFEIKLPLSYDSDEPVKAKDLGKVLMPQVHKLLSHSELDTGALRKVALVQMDGVWQDHLENMSMLQEGIHLESMAGRKPEEVFVERGYEVFEGMIEELKGNLASRILPAAAQL